MQLTVGVFALDLGTPLAAHPTRNFFGVLPAALWRETMGNDQRSWDGAHHAALARLQPRQARDAPVGGRQRQSSLQCGHGTHASVRLSRGGCS